MKGCTYHVVSRGRTLSSERQRNWGKCREQHTPVFAASAGAVALTSTTSGWRAGGGWKKGREREGAEQLILPRSLSSLSLSSAPHPLQLSPPPRLPLSRRPPLARLLSLHHPKSICLRTRHAATSSIALTPSQGSRPLSSLTGLPLLLFQSLFVVRGNAPQIVECALRH